MTGRLIAQLGALRQHVEVAEFLKPLQDDPDRVDSRTPHYVSSVISSLPEKP